MADTSVPTGTRRLMPISRGPFRRENPRVAVIGAGIGGLTAAALLLKEGCDVAVLEAHVYPGGSAGTFYHKKFRFDAGATLAGGFGPGGPHTRVAEILGLDWPVTPVDPAWVVHLPDGRTVTQWADPERWHAERQAAFPGTESFWQLQERLADLAWDISTRHFPWPPQSPRDFAALFAAMRPRTLGALPYLLRPIGRFASSADPMFFPFLDGQLLISAQTTADRANALYAAAALDLPRRGVNHVRGGMGGLADTLARWIVANGGQVHYRQEVTRIDMEAGLAKAVHTTRGLRIEADFVLANVTPWGLAALLQEDTPRPLVRDLDRKLKPTWGAFTVYLGLDRARLSARFPDLAGHHQVIVDPSQPLGEGNSVFVSLADPADTSRAPAGQIPVTLSTHTAIGPWWDLHAKDPAAYGDRKEAYLARMVQAVEQALPGFRKTVGFQMAGTPVTFQRFTRRPRGMVGGFPQTSLLSARGPATGIPNLRLVGDSIFPGQSTAGVTLGAMRVARDVLQSLPRGRPVAVGDLLKNPFAL